MYKEESSTCYVPVGGTHSIFESMLRGGELWWSFGFRGGHELVGSVLVRSGDSEG